MIATATSAETDVLTLYDLHTLKDPTMPAGFPRLLTPSADLAAVIGPEPLPRTDMVSRIWAYIREHNLQEPADKRIIVADEKLRAVFGRDRVHMMEMMGLLSSHLK